MCGVEVRTNETKWAVGRARAGVGGGGGSVVRLILLLLDHGSVLCSVMAILLLMLLLLLQNEYVIHTYTHIRTYMTLHTTSHHSAI